MLCIPSAAEPLVKSFLPAFTRRTADRMVVLAVGLILVMGRRTVTAVLWTMRGLVEGHFSTYHRVFSRASWSAAGLGRILARLILAAGPPDEPVVLIVDDTTAQHRGNKVYGKARHHDAVRSTHRHVVWRWGHRWVVLAVPVKFPWASRAWALPVLAVLYKAEALNRAEGHRHKTATVLARQLMALLVHWFPDRRFIVLGDGGYASHELARFCARHARHLALVSRFYPDAALHAPPPARPRNRGGRPRVKGRRLPTPRAVVAKGRRQDATVTWYGGSARKVELVSGTGGWYKAGQGLVAVRWVFVHDLQGTHRDEYFYTTDLTLTPAQIVSLYTARWSIEVTFQEVRAHLGFETTKQWTKKAVLRTAPLLLALFSLISLIFDRHVRSRRVRLRATAWYAKGEPTFADAIAAVRRLFWRETVFRGPRFHDAFQKLPRPLKNMLLDRISDAA